MTEYEFGELYALIQDAAYMQYLVFTGALFAYLIAGHLVGLSLPKKLATGISTIYSLFVLLPVGAYWMEMSRMSALALDYQAKYPGGYVVPEIISSPFNGAVLILLMFIAWLGSIYYVHFHVRGST